MMELPKSKRIAAAHASICHSQGFNCDKQSCCNLRIPVISGVGDFGRSFFTLYLHALWYSMFQGRGKMDCRLLGDACWAGIYIQG